MANIEKDQVRKKIYYGWILKDKVFIVLSKKMENKTWGVLG